MSEFLSQDFDVSRSCISKSRYPSDELAMQVARRCWDEREVALRSYLCDKCAGWHLTKRDAVPPPDPKPGWTTARQSQRDVARERDRRRRRNQRWRK